MQQQIQAQSSQLQQQQRTIQQHDRWRQGVREREQHRRMETSVTAGYILLFITSLHRIIHTRRTMEW
jgi:hypothetical protein